MTTIEDLYYGNICPFDHTAERNSREENLLSLICRNEKVLTKNLKKEQIETFEKFKDNQSELAELTERRAFTQGFSLAIKLMTEAMQATSSYETE